MTAAERVVVADRYPAVVFAPDGSRYEQARVVLTRDQLYVFVVEGDQVVQVPPTQVWLPKGSVIGRGAWTIYAALGEYRVERGQGCGCSSPLKRFVPWTPWRVGRL